MAGYSGTPLLKKLGYKPGLRACLIAVPRHLSDLTEFDSFASRKSLRHPGKLADEPGPFDLVHMFVTEEAMLERALGTARWRIAPDGMVWVSWPKKASKVATDVTEDVIRRHALAAGLVDVKVCAVDETWSGLKLVIPKAARAAMTVVLPPAPRRRR